MFCDQCGHPADTQDDAFCAACGTRLRAVKQARISVPTRRNAIRAVLILSSAALAGLVLAVGLKRGKDPSAVLLGDVADVTCQSRAAIEGRPPASIEAHCKTLDFEHEAEFNTVFRTDPACNGFRVVALQSPPKTVPAHYLTVTKWTDAEDGDRPKWHWVMNGAKLSGTTLTLKQAAHDICGVMKGRGGVVE
jgi:hypothetical protein